jgi:hypothetical protein
MRMSDVLLSKSLDQVNFNSENFLACKNSIFTKSQNKYFMDPIIYNKFRKERQTIREMLFFGSEQCHAKQVNIYDSYEVKLMSYKKLVIHRIIYLYTHDCCKILMDCMQFSIRTNHLKNILWIA